MPEPKLDARWDAIRATRVLTSGAISMLPPANAAIRAK